MNRQPSKSAAAPSAAPDPIVKEFPALGKYRVRVVRVSVKGAAILDIREYATGPSFEGFTRRGVRLASIDDLRTLRDSLTEILDGNLLGTGGQA